MSLEIKRKRIVIFKRREGDDRSETDRMTYPPIKYVVASRKIKEYAGAIGERDPLCTTKRRPRGPYGDIVAPPTFAVV
jgi:hypothetical protein